jgi:hypothetical protein
MARAGLAAVGIASLAFVAGCSASHGTQGTGGEPPLAPSTCAPDGGPLYPVLSDPTYSPDFRMRLFGEVTFMGTQYQIVNSMPYDYLLSSVQAGKTFPMTETDDYYAVESNFALPYIPCVMDEVAWTPGTTNLGWAIGATDDPAALVTMNGAGRPFVYSVVADNEYGYFTHTAPLPGDTVGYSGFRPTWVVHPVTMGASYQMFYIDPTNPDKYGFSWPRHGMGWELIFGLFVDPGGVVYVPKRAPLAIPGWDTYDECVTINLADAPVPTTRTQFPGNESYYAAETFIPGYAAPPGIGDRYWGQKGRPMSEVAIWENDGAPGLPSPGNYHKPYEGGCDTQGYNFAHAEGFTWPALRQYWTQHGDIPTKEQLYSITLYKVASDGTTTLLGTLSYTQQADGEWIPTASGPEAHSLNDANGRWIINGPIFADRGERAVAVIQNL